MRSIYAIRCVLIPWTMFYFVENDSGKDEVELFGCDALMQRISLWHFVGAAFESFMVQCKSILIPQQYFHASAGAAEKNIQLPAEWIFVQFVTDKPTQAVDTLTHIGTAPV